MAYRIKVVRINDNATEIELPGKTEYARGVMLLISYNTVVAAYVPGVGYIASKQHWSMTTSRHISTFAGRAYRDLPHVPQEWLDHLAAPNEEIVTQILAYFETVPATTSAE